jgi:hypothetical protein
MAGSIWQFLKDPVNLGVLGSIGAVMATIAACAWSVFTFFAKKSEKGVGRELRKPREPLRDELERLVAQVARDKGVEVAPLRAVLVKLGEAGVKDEDIPKRLDEKADELVKLRDKVDELTLRSHGLASGRAGRQGWRRPFPPIG